MSRTVGMRDIQLDNPRESAPDPLDQGLRETLSAQGRNGTFSPDSLLVTSSRPPWREYIKMIAMKVYKYLLLRLPSLYFNRVGRIFIEAHLTKFDVDQLIQGHPGLPPRETRNLRPSPTASLQGIGAGLQPHEAPFHGLDIYHRGLVETIRKLEQFKAEWEAFVEGLVKEWETLNLISTLLIGVILTLFQIEEAAFHPVTRTAAFLALISSLLSLSFGGLFVLQFRIMRSLVKAGRLAAIWVKQATGHRQHILWNLWVLLSLPAVWTAYSLAFFCVALLSFLWTSGTGTHVNPVTSNEKSAVILVPRVLGTVIFLIGAIQFVFTVKIFAGWTTVPFSPSDGLNEAVNTPIPGDDDENRTGHNDGFTEVSQARRHRRTRLRRINDPEGGQSELDDPDVNRYPTSDQVSPSVEQSNRLRADGIPTSSPQVTEPPPLRARSTFLSDLARNPDRSLGEDREPIRIAPTRDNGFYPMSQRDRMHDVSVGIEPSKILR